MQMTQNEPRPRGRRSRFSTEQKLALLQQWQAGTPAAELCRTHGFSANALSRWKKRLDHGLSDRGELVPKSQFAALQRKIDDLERALGRKSLEVDILKKAYELKNLR
jgi:transposase